MGIEHLVKFVCHCGEKFECWVWHCPICHHHWTAEMENCCGNCHLVKVSRAGIRQAQFELEHSQRKDSHGQEMGR